MLKPKVLLVPNISTHILGKFAQKIEELLKDKFDFCFVSEPVLRLQKGAVARYLENFDVILVLANTTLTNLHDIFSTQRAKTIVWIHHMTPGTEPAINRAIVNSSRQILSGKNLFHTLEDRFATKPTILEYGISPIENCPSHLCKTGRLRLGFIASKLSDQDGNRKGFPLFIEIIKQLRAEMPIQGVVLGIGWQQDLKRSGLNPDDYEYHSFVSDQALNEFYNSLDILLVTSSVEGGPYTAIESLSIGTPVIGTKIGHLPQLIIDQENGVLLDTRTTESFCGAVREWISLGKPKSHVRNISNPILSRFRWENWKEPLEKLFSEVSGNGRRVRSREGAVAVSFFSFDELRSLDSLAWVRVLLKKGLISWKTGLSILYSYFSLYHGLKAVIKLVRFRLLRIYG
jgi:hypothetical protein